MSARARKSGSEVRESAHRWEEETARHYQRAGDVVSYTISSEDPPPPPPGSNDHFFKRGGRSYVDGDGSFWRIWAEWVLTRAGLPAPEDFGERSLSREEALMKYQFASANAISETVTALDSPENRLMRVMERFDPHSAEACAARIEWWFLTDQAKGAAEVLHFLGILRAKDVEAILEPDARKHRRVKAVLKIASEEHNERAAEEAQGRKARWAQVLKRAGYLPLGKRHTVKDAAGLLAERFGLEERKVYATLRRDLSEAKKKNHFVKAGRALSR